MPDLIVCCDCGRLVGGCSDRRRTPEVGLGRSVAQALNERVGASRPPDGGGGRYRAGPLPGPV